MVFGILLIVQTYEVFRHNLAIVGCEKTISDTLGITTGPSWSITGAEIVMCMQMAAIARNKL